VPKELLADDLFINIHGQHIELPPHYLWRTEIGKREGKRDKNGTEQTEFKARKGDGEKGF
jgi:hypothetical protein